MQLGPTATIAHGNQLKICHTRGEISVAFVPWYPPTHPPPARTESAKNTVHRTRFLHLTHYPTQLSKKVRQQQHGSGTNFQLEITAFVCKLENESLNQQISQFVWTGLLVWNIIALFWLRRGLSSFSRGESCKGGGGRQVTVTGNKCGLVQPKPHRQPQTKRISLFLFVATQSLL